MTLSDAQRNYVRERAGNCCEYCRLSANDSPAPFHVDHIIPQKHDGTDDFDNLCFSCFKCNAHKSHDLTGFDPQTGEIARIFHPRKQQWEDHFELDDDMFILGKTAIGRTTAKVLRMNDEERVESRQILADIDEYPCT